MGRSVLVLAAVCVFGVVACGDDGGGSVEAFCESAQDFADSEDFLDIDDPENFAAGLDEARDLIDALADTAPDEISDDAETAAATTGELIDSLEDLDATDQEAIDAAFAPFFDEDADPEFAAAVENINEFALTECDIDIEGSG